MTWAEAFGDDFRGAWNACPRGDWLLAVAARCKVDRRRLVALAASCAALALDCVPTEEARPRRGIEAARAWAGGQLDAAGVRRALAEIQGFEAMDPAVAAARDAALAALCSIDDPTAASLAAASAAQSALLGVPDCAMLSALGHAHFTAAELVRDGIEFDALLDATRCPGD